jgi:hypothetical protein
MYPVVDSIVECGGVRADDLKRKPPRTLRYTKGRPEPLRTLRYTKGSQYLFGFSLVYVRALGGKWVSVSRLFAYKFVVVRGGEQAIQLRRVLDFDLDHPGAVGIFVDLLGSRG